MHINIIYTGHSMQRPQRTPQICSWKERTKFIQHVTLTQATPINHGSTPRVAMTIRRCAIEIIKVVQQQNATRYGLMVQKSGFHASVEDMRMLLPWFTGWFSTSNFGAWLFGISEPSTGWCNPRGNENYSKKNKENNPTRSKRRPFGAEKPWV